MNCAKFTGKNASETIVRHAGETVGMAVATGATAVAAGVTLGKIDGLNNAVEVCGKRTGVTGARTGKATVETTNDILNGTPVVGHIKGGIHYAFGDTDGGNTAMKSATRTSGVVGGAVVGTIVAGPAGTIGGIIGGIAGGAASDGAITGIESGITGKYRPSGQIAAWTSAIKAENSDDRTEAIFGILATPIMDGVAGYSTAKARQGGGPKAKRSAKANDKA